MSTAEALKNAAALVKHASDAYNASDFDLAIGFSREALALIAGDNSDDSQHLLDKAYERLAMAHQRIGSYSTARDVVLEWQDCTQREEGQVMTAIQLSRIESYLGHYDEAARLADEAIEHAQAADYRFELGMAKRVRADLMWKLGHPDQALVLGQEAITLLEQVGDMEQRAAAHVTVAAAHHYMGQFYKSIVHLQRCARLVEQLGRRFEMAIVYSNLGETYAEIYAMDKALDAHQKALELVGEDRAHPDLLRNLGVDLIGVGRESEGARYLQTALVRASQINDPDLVAQVLYSLAEVNLKAGRLDEAERYGKELMTNAKTLDSLRHRVRALMVLGSVAQRQGDHFTAQMHFHDCSMLAQRSSDSHAIWQTHAALHDLLRESMPQMADIHRRIAAEMMNTILAGIEDEELHAIFRQAEPVQSVLGPRNGAR